MRSFRILKTALLIVLLVLNNIAEMLGMLINGHGAQMAGLLLMLISGTGGQSSTTLARSQIPVTTHHNFIGRLTGNSNMQFAPSQSSGRSTSSLTQGSISLSVNSFEMSLAQLVITGGPVFITRGGPLFTNRHSTGIIKLSLKTASKPKGISTSIASNLVSFTVQFNATLQLEASPGSFTIPAILQGVLNLDSYTVSGTIKSQVPLGVPLIGGTALNMNTFLKSIPATEVVSDRGLTSYNTYTSFGVGGQTALVNLTNGNGNLVIDPVDLAMPGQGLSVVLERVYSVQDDEEGVFGFGWSSFLDTRLERCSVALCGCRNDGLTYDKEMFYKDPTGATFTFDGMLGSRGHLLGIQGRAKGLHAKLVVGPSRTGSPILIYDSGITYKFSRFLESRDVDRLTAIQDRNGNEIKIYRDENGKPFKIEDSLKRTITINIEGGLVKSVIPNVPGLAQVFYEYISGAFLSKVEKKDAQGLSIQTVKYEKDEKFRLKSIIDPRNFYTKFTYSESTIEVCIDYGRTREKQISKAKTINYGRLPGDFDPPDPPDTSKADTYSYNYDNSVPGQPIVKVTNPRNEGTVYTFYNPAGYPNMTYIRDIAIGRTTTLVYDENYFETTVAGQALRTRSWEYDPDGRLEVYELRFFNSKDEIVRFKTKLTYYEPSSCPPPVLSDPNRTGTFNTPGCIGREFEPLKYGVMFSDRQCDPTTPEGRNCYLDSFLVTSVINPEGDTTEFRYDGKGNPRFITNALGKVTEFDYHFDAAHPQGTLKSIKRPRGEISFGYTYNDSSGNLTKTTVTDQLGRQSTTMYDGVGRPTEHINARGNLTAYQLDILSQLKEVTYQDGTKVIFDYDDNNNVKSMTDVTGKTEFFCYDGETGCKDGRDHRNRPKHKRLPGGQVISYEYDGVGNLSSKTDAGGTIKYAYDAVNRLIELTEPDNVSKVTYEDYDDNDRPRTVKYPNGMTIEQEWDNAGRLKRIHAMSMPPSPPKTLVDLKYEYEFIPSVGAIPVESLLLHKVTDTDGNVTTYSYDKLNQLTDENMFPSSGAVVGRSWAYDDNNNRKTQRVGIGSDSVVTTYDYNDADQLTQISTKLPSDPAPKILSYTYDNDGNLTDRSDGLHLEYNAADFTTSITPPTSAGGAAAKRTMIYSGLDQTQRVSVQKGAEPATKFTYDQTGIGPSSEQSGSAGASPSYITYTPNGELVSIRRGGKTFYYVTDRLSSVVALTASDPGGSGEAVVVNRYRYDAWGNILSESEDSNAHQPFRFVSAEFDASTKLYKMGARYYDPAIGRFTQPDPIGSGYVYVANDPVNVTDRLGYFGLPQWVKDVGAVIAITVAIVTVTLGFFLVFAVIPATLTIGALTLQGWTIAAAGGVTAGLLAGLAYADVYLFNEITKKQREFEHSVELLLDNPSLGLKTKCQRAGKC